MDTVCSGSGGPSTRSSSSPARPRGRRPSLPKGLPLCPSGRQSNLRAPWSGGASACPDQSASCVPPHAPWAAAPCGPSVWATVGWRRKGGLGIVLFRQVRDFYFLRLRGLRDVRLELLRGLLRVGRRRIGLWRLRRCDRRWRRQIRRLVHRRRRIGRRDGLGLGCLRSGRDLLRRRWRRHGEGREINHDRGRRSVRRGLGLTPVEGRPGRGKMDRGHNNRRRAPAKRGKRHLPSHGPAISALRHGRGAPFIGPGASAPAELGLVGPFDWPVSSRPTNAIFR